MRDKIGKEEKGEWKSIRKKYVLKTGNIDSIKSEKKLLLELDYPAINKW